MNIALIGYGKMGKEIERLILADGIHSIGLIISSENKDAFTIEALASIDVAIDFTQPDAAYNNVMTCFQANTPVVVGTTAWEEEYEKAKEYCIKHKKSMLVASNFSIGVLIFSKVTSYLASLMKSQPQYKLDIEEIHHTEKKDAPSGTAIHLAKTIMNSSDGLYSEWELGQKSNKNTIPIEAKRLPHVPGTHIINYESHEDQIELVHKAKNREGFARGAIKAAEFLNGKIGVYSMEDLL